MTELQRLLLSSEDELERALLGSVLAESPSPEALRDTALALGLTTSAAAALLTVLPPAAASVAVPAASATFPLAGAASSGASAASVAGASAATTASVTSATATASAVSLATLGKSLVGGALASFLALTTIEHTLPAPMVEPPTAGTSRPARTEAAAIPTADAARALPQAAASAEPPEATAAEPSARRSTSRAALPRASSRTRPSAPAPAAFEVETAPVEPATRAPSAASLAEETRLLDRARGALAHGETASASQALGQYYSSRPSAVLAHEAALLRVRLLLATGQRAAAAEQARRIISLHPQDAHADSLRRLAAER